MKQNLRNLELKKFDEMNPLSVVGWLVDLSIVLAMAGRSFDLGLAVVVFVPGKLSWVVMLG